MRVLAFLLIAIVASVFARTAEELEKLSEDEYTKMAVDELRAMQKKRILSDVQKPDCSINKEEKEIRCSVQFKWMKRDRKVGLSVIFDPHKVSLTFGVQFDARTIFSYGSSLGEICGPLPGLLKRLNICAQAYYVDINVKPHFKFDVCVLLKLSSVFHFDLNCLSYDDVEKKFSHNSKYKAEDVGIFTMSLADGNVDFERNNPISDRSLRKIRNVLDEFSDKAKHEVEKFTHNVEDKWNEAKDSVKEGVSNVKNEIKNTADKVVGEMENAFDKAKQKADEVKDKLTGWVNGIFG